MNKKRLFNIEKGIKYKWQVTSIQNKNIILLSISKLHVLKRRNIQKEK